MTDKKQTSARATELSEKKNETVELTEADMEKVRGGRTLDRSSDDASGSNSSKDLAKDTEPLGIVIKEWET